MGNLLTQSSASGKNQLEVAIKCAEAAAQIIRLRILDTFERDSKIKLGLSTKNGWNDRVTEVDGEAEKAIIEILESEYPEHGIIAEESGVQGSISSPFQWYIDPIDGTRNFASGLPHTCVSVGLWQKHAPILGVLIAPIRNETFTAVNGGGAKVNGIDVFASEEGNLSEALLGFDMGYNPEQGNFLLSAINELWPQFQSVRMMGSAALGITYSGCARLDLYAHHYVQPWDIAAAIVFVQEAGGLVTDLNGEKIHPHSGHILAGSPAIHKVFMNSTADSKWRKSVKNAD